MTTANKRLGLAVLAGVAAWGLAGSPAFGQARHLGNSRQLVNPAFQVAPGLPLNQAAFNTAVLGRAAAQVPPWAYGFNPVAQALVGGVPAYSPLAYNPLLSGLGPYASMTSTPYASPYTSPGYGGAGYGSTYSNPYGSYYYPDPYGGGLRGAAEAIEAQGKYEIQFQQARLLNQEVQRSKLDTRRKIFDEWLYERANTPTLQDIRERAQKYELRRALVSPDLTDLVSGYALNTILDDLEKRPKLASDAAAIDPSILKQVNVKPKATAGNVGVLKPVVDGTSNSLNWPLPLQGADYQDEVKRLNELATEAVKLAQNTGQVDAATLNNMNDDIRKLRAKVASHRDELTWNQSVEANRFLNQLSDAVTALQNPNVANIINNKLAAKGKTVADFVQYMAKNGLEVAPAGNGDEAAYAALHNYLVGLAQSSPEFRTEDKGSGGK
ncbi:MAG TPA: hypothetical protein VJ739_03120 [Gemmataceae bacterium]|nr:hypothetical protein [Gemmataceae bacterium]